MATKQILLVLLLLSMPCAYAATTSLLLPSKGVGLDVVLTDYDPSPAKPGKYVTLYIKAENSGGAVLQNTVFKLQLAYPFSMKPGESNEKFVGSIGAKEQVLLEYDLYVDKDAIQDTYTLKLRMCLDRSCSTYLETPFDVSVQTGGTPKIEAGLEDADIFTGGKRGTVTIHILNRGLLDTKFLVAELQNSEKYEIISPPRVYIGELESDDFETIEYDIYVKGDVAMAQSEKIMLPVLIEYSDSNDKEYSETQNVALNIYSKQDLTNMGLAAGGSGTLVKVIMGIVGIFALYILYKKFRKRKHSS